jgi:hypothetical protein
MNVLLIYYIFFNVVVFTSASTNIASVSKDVEHEPVKNASLHEWTFTSLADQVPFPSFYYILRFACEKPMMDLMRIAIDSGKFDINVLDKRFNNLPHCIRFVLGPKILKWL